ncbi:MAG: hypothetical protein WC748_06960 [Legionellales bacterium]|jgi:hypothetical protein
MIEQIFQEQYAPEFQYLLEDTLEYDATNLVLKGRYKYNNSPYLVLPDKLMNSEDMLFIMNQAVYCFLFFYLNNKNNIDIKHFKDNFLENMVAVSQTFQLKSHIYKAKDPNTFSLRLIKKITDKKQRDWFKLQFEMSDHKYNGNIKICLLHENVHKMQATI